MERVLSVENHHPVKLRDFACAQFLARGRDLPLNWELW